MLVSLLCADRALAVSISPSHTEHLLIHPDYPVQKEFSLLRPAQEPIDGFNISEQKKNTSSISLVPEKIFFEDSETDEKKTVQFFIDGSKAKNETTTLSIVATSKNSVAVKKGVQTRLALIHNVSFSPTQKRIVRPEFGYTTVQKKDGKGEAGTIFTHIHNGGNVPLYIEPLATISFVQHKTYTYDIPINKTNISPYSSQELTIPFLIEQNDYHFSTQEPVDVFITLRATDDLGEEQILRKKIYRFIPTVQTKQSTVLQHFSFHLLLVLAVLTLVATTVFILVSLNKSTSS